MAIGFDTAVIGSVTLGMLLMVLGMLLIVGAILWVSRANKLKAIGQVMTVFALVVLIVLTIALAVKPAEVTIPEGEQPGAFDVISVSGVTNADYAESSKTFTVVMTTDPDNGTVSPTSMAVSFSVQRTDSGDTTNIKTVSASVSQVKLTDPVTGDSYYAILPTSYGDPDVDWDLNPGDVTATNTLSAQIGLTPYEVGTFNVTINWNAAAYCTDNIAENDVIYVGSITVGGEVYSLYVLIDDRLGYDG